MRSRAESCGVVRSDSMRACVRAEYRHACVRACVLACVRACVLACVGTYLLGIFPWELPMGTSHGNL